MAIRPAKRWNFVAAQIRFALLEHWKLALFLIAVIAFFIFVGLWRGRESDSVVEETAEVLRFGSYATDDGDHPIVFVRLRDGIVRQLPTSRATLRLCRAGSLIRVLRGSSTLRVSPLGCAPPTP
jgi:hypothetical protein